MNTENDLLQTREEEGGTFERTLVASEFLDWLLQEGELATREEAEQLGHRLLEHGIIQHGKGRGPRQGRGLVMINRGVTHKWRNLNVV